ncbi:unnamed protein product [Bemisia tabaci]|uniref:Uncharacterized protein n=1 Tax=Bemisia tabaci TaxID=7038 RepID=A0A9P0A9L2_BEMTA|nr:unnamed protein product [Bemisia tabaci]
MKVYLKVDVPKLLMLPGLPIGTRNQNPHVYAEPDPSFGTEPSNTFLHGCLIRAPGFSFSARPRECLPQGFPAEIPGTCHFLDSYHHPGLPEDADLDAHITAGMADIEASNAQDGT